MRLFALSPLLLFLALLTATPVEAQFWDPRALDGDPATAAAPLAPGLTGLGAQTWLHGFTRLICLLHGNSLLGGRLGDLGGIGISKTP